MITHNSAGGFPGGAVGRRCKRCGFDPWIRKIPWRRKWQHTPVFFPGEFYGQRSLEGYSPWGCKGSDTTERLSMHTLVVPPIQRAAALFSDPETDVSQHNSRCYTGGQVCIGRHRSLGSNSVCLGWNLRICIFNKPP